MRHPLAFAVAFPLAAFSLIASVPAALADSEHAMTGAMGSMAPHHGAHMRLTPKQAARSGDRARAADVHARMSEAIAKYHDIRIAERDGYRPFGEPEGDGDDVHYVHVGHSIAENWRLDPTRPGALLYDKRGGQYRLVGAMFVAPPGASLETLDERYPLSEARWHLHTNICTPRPIWSREKWALEHASGTPLYGPESPIATREECREAGGKFHPTIFGWMVHVYL